MQKCMHAYGYNIHTYVCIHTYEQPMQFLFLYLSLSVCVCVFVCVCVSDEPIVNGQAGDLFVLGMRVGRVRV